MGICWPDSTVPGKMGTLCEGVVVWGGYAIPPLEKLLDLGEKGSPSSAV